ncbi:CoA-binding protein [Halorubellus sp. JP-L1]|uniref:CoA-binding protein n=1 Tax=Halorubellus sp. JP-L1 TaxID=2715753 RepID=UPI00140A8470|nr:CoA-binding protein [Halorubellus sp. JP-L1]NHN40039.1 CoA-binding protein [Halorubellus sp. JP-L1]
MAAATDSELREVLDAETIAVVGCSSTPGKAAHDVPKYLLEHGYDVIPVNPYAEEVFGIEAVDSLADVDARVDVVDVFRPSDEVPGIVDEVLAREDVDAVWLQLGISHDEAGTRVEESGRAFVQDTCIKVEHSRLVA